MTLDRIAARDAQIDTHLFLLCPNNSGSTYLSSAIARSQHVLSLAKEGQHMFGFAGPHTRNSPFALVWGGTPEGLATFADGDYDWKRTKKAWYFHAEGAEDANVFHTRSPPFLLVSDQLRANFRDARFILMVRDPYATLEGIVRRRRGAAEDLPLTDLPTVAARHLVTCFEKQRANRETLAGCSTFFTYEALCADPQAVAAQVEDLLPQLGDLDLSQRLRVKGMYDEPLRDMNEEQISRLSPEDIAAANAVFEQHEDLLTQFGYALRR